MDAQNAYIRPGLGDVGDRIFGRSRAARSARFSLPSLLRSPLRGLFGAVQSIRD